MAYLPLMQGSSPMAEPVWPSACRLELDRGNPQRSTMEPVVRAAKACSERDDDLAKFIRQVPVCVVWTKPWSGTLGSSMLFHARRTEPDLVVVGYFAYWTTERPFGDNDLTRWVLPALAVDAVYSHLLFVLPGLQQVMYGPGDIEGVRVTYRQKQSGQLVPIAVYADDSRHRELSLDITEAVDDRGRILVLSDAWSHQLGGQHAVTVAHNGAMQRCFLDGAMRAVSDEVVKAFALGSVGHPRRAKPAWRLDEKSGKS
jgi:hypothetical protein